MLSNRITSSPALDITVLRREDTQEKGPRPSSSGTTGGGDEAMPIRTSAVGRVSLNRLPRFLDSPTNSQPLWKPPLHPTIPTPLFYLLQIFPTFK